MKSRLLKYAFMLLVAAKFRRLILYAFPPALPNYVGRNDRHLLPHKIRTDKGKQLIT